MPTKSPLSRHRIYRLACLEPQLDQREALLDSCDRRTPFPPPIAGWARRLLERAQRLAGLPRELPEPDANPFEYFRALIVLFDRRRALIRQQQQALIKNRPETYPRSVATE